MATPSSSRPPLRQYKRDFETAQLDSIQSSAKRTQAAIAQGGLERQVVSLKEQNITLGRKLKEALDSVETLRRDQRSLKDIEEALRRERDEANSTLESETANFTSELRILRAKVNTLKESNTDLAEKHEALQHQFTKKSFDLEQAVLGKEDLTRELKTTKRFLQERSDEIDVVKQKLIQQDYINAAGGVKENRKDKDEAVIQAELHRQTTYLRELERTNRRLTAENTRLTERNTSIAILQEEKRGLEGKLVTMDALRARVAELEVQLQSSSSKSSSGGSAAQTDDLSSLHFKNAQLLSERGTMLEERAIMKAKLEAAQAQVQEANSAFDALDAEKVDLERRLSDIEGKWAAGEGENKFLRDYLASYTQESQIAPDAAGSTSLPSSSTSSTDLELLLARYQTLKENEARMQASRDDSTTEAYQVRLKETETALTVERAKATQAEERLKTLTEEQTTHLTQIDSLEQELFELRGEIAGGRHVPPGVRILQLADNPESRWAEMRQAALDRLKSENEALLKRLRELGSTTLASTSSLQALGEQEQPSLPPPRQMEGMGETTTTTADLVPRASWELLNREKMDLQEELTQKDKRLQRLKEVYNAKGAEFRDAIASILGVKLSFRPNGEVRATSIYDLGASFAFQPAKGTMQLVAQGEGGPQDLPSMMKYWIGGEQCIPGFMASVTLECYEYAKRKGGQGQGGD